jgi:hypothetical protein
VRRTLIKAERGREGAKAGVRRVSLSPLELVRTGSSFQRKLESHFFMTLKVNEIPAFGPHQNSTLMGALSLE